MAGVECLRIDGQTRLEDYRTNFAGTNHILSMEHDAGAQNPYLPISPPFSRLPLTLGLVNL